MTLEEARNAIREMDAAVKAVYPDAWVMFVCTVGGHLQFSINRPKRWGLFTLDIPAGASDWLELFKAGIETTREFVSELRKPEGEA